MHDAHEPSAQTRAVHAGRDDLAADGLIVPPIDLSTTYLLADIDRGGESYDNLTGGGTLVPGESPVYLRLWNPTIARFEDALAELEHADGAVAFASGMAVITAVLQAAVVAGTPHVVAVRPVYGGTDSLLSQSILGTEVTWTDQDGVAEAITDRTGLVYLETPANPTLDLVDIAHVVQQAGEVPVAVDNTFATPLLQRPIELGAAVSLHSATKYLGGHSDVVAGVAAARSDWVERLRTLRVLTGAVLHPEAGYLLHRGLQTLPVRLQAAQESTSRVADWLQTRPEVDQVFHPSVPGRDPRGLVGRQQSGTGAMVSFSLAGGYAAAARVAGAVRIIQHAVSLGGVESLIQHPAAVTHRPVPPESRPAASVLRLSIGLEDANDLIADLQQALDS